MESGYAMAAVIAFAFLVFVTPPPPPPSASAPIGPQPQWHPTPEGWVRDRDWMRDWRGFDV